MRSLSVVNRNGDHATDPQPLLMEEVRAFFAPYLSPTVLEVFPDWQGILLACEPLAISVWIVRTIHDGRQLHATTGHPALLLTDLLSQKGEDFAEAWRVLQPCLIFAHGGDERLHEETVRKRTEERD
jgi:hypothetical protein